MLQVDSPSVSDVIIRKDPENEVTIRKEGEHVDDIAEQENETDRDTRDADGSTVVLDKGKRRMEVNDMSDD